MRQRDLDLLMGAAFFLVGALLAVLAKVYLLAPEPETSVWIFGPGTEPECVASAREAREHKRTEEGPFVPRRSPEELELDDE